MDYINHSVLVFIMRTVIHTSQKKFHLTQNKQDHIKEHIHIHLFINISHHVFFEHQHTPFNIHLDMFYYPFHTLHPMFRNNHKQKIHIHQNNQIFHNHNTLICICYQKFYPTYYIQDHTNYYNCNNIFFFDIDCEFKIILNKLSSIIKNLFSFIINILIKIIFIYIVFNLIKKK